MVAQRVYVQGFAGQTLLGTLMPAAKPIHQLTPEERSKPAKMEEFFVDLGLPGPRVKELVEIGDMVTMARTTELYRRTMSFPSPWTTACACL